MCFLFIFLPLNHALACACMRILASPISADVVDAFVLVLLSATLLRSTMKLAIVLDIATIC